MKLHLFGRIFKMSDSWKVKSLFLGTTPVYWNVD